MFFFQVVLSLFFFFKKKKKIVCIPLIYAKLAVDFTVQLTVSSLASDFSVIKSHKVGAVKKRMP